VRVANLSVVFAQLLVLSGILALWQWGYRWSLAGIPGVGIFDPYFFSTPAEMWSRFLSLGCFVDRAGGWAFAKSGTFGTCIANGENNLWVATAATLLNTFWGFVTGVPSGVLLGLILGRSRFLGALLEPFIVALNSIPGVALAPLFILMLGFGDASKIVTSWLAVIMIVFFNTFEGARTVDRTMIAAARLLGASGLQLMWTVIIPSTLAWVFAVLTPAVSFALVGVVVAEFMGSNYGLGRLIVDAESRADSADMMIGVIVLMIVGVVLATGIQRLQRYLLRWQPHFHALA
jgi:NitT/TauT family transport system permease protein